MLRRHAKALPALFILVGTALDLLLPDVTISATFAAAPLTAAALLSTRGTVITGIVSSVVLSLLTVFYDEDAVTLQGELRAVTVITVSVFAVGVNYVLRRTDRQLATARVVAEAAQLAVLPTPPARVHGLKTAARYQAAQADARIGGDFYVVQETPHGIRMIVGDVRGKGLGAVEAVVIVIGAFREAAETETTLAGVAARLDRALDREGGRRLGESQFEGFTTAVLAEVCVDPDGPPGAPATLRLVNRGHPAPLLLDRGRVHRLEPTLPALPLGVTELGVTPDRTDEAPFPLGSQLLLYTDGMSEARNGEGVFYDPVERLTGRTFVDPDELVDMLVEDVRTHTGGGADDDMALLAVDRRVGWHRGLTAARP